MNANLKEKILDALCAVIDPGKGSDIVSLGMVSGLQVSEAGEAVFVIEVDPAQGPALESLRQEAEQTVSKIPQVTKATAILTAEKKETDKRVSKMDPHGMDKNPKLDLPVKSIIAVASGKGGVGKSTVAANLAVALARMGLKTGLLDADIYGPSQPRMMGLRDKSGKGLKPDGSQGRIEPLQAHGVRVMSIGFMVDDESPLIWRGPMVQSAIYQMLRDVEWAEPGETLDVMVVDMPPGTGDAQLTMAQKVPLAGAVIVSTPQDIALLDARKAVGMFAKTGVPVLGIIENMSYYHCPSCGHEDHIFGHGGAEAEAQRLGCTFLGRVPLHADIRLKGDEGAPVTAADPDGAHAQAFMQIAQKVAERIAKAP